MSDSIVCPHCGHSHSVPGPIPSGRKATCKKCNQPFVVAAHREEIYESSANPIVDELRLLRKELSELRLQIPKKSPENYSWARYPFIVLSGLFLLWMEWRSPEPMQTLTFIGTLMLIAIATRPDTWEKYYGF